MSISEKLITIAENQQKVFDAGRNSGGGGSYDEGYNDGYSSGFADGETNGWDIGYSNGWDSGYGEGQQSEYDRFWDNFQDYGNRTNYEDAFNAAHGIWNDDTFRPKYDLIFGDGYYGYSAFKRLSVTNLAETLENLGVQLDTSRCGNLAYLFQSSTTQRIPTIDCTNAHGNASAGLEYSFFDCGSLHTIDKLIVTEQLKYVQTFNYCPSLVNIVFDGVIGNDISFRDSTNLSKASITSIVNHLSTTASGKYLTLSKTAVTNAFGSTTASAWTSLVNSRSNWTISLV